MKRLHGQAQLLRNVAVVMAMALIAGSACVLAADSACSNVVDGMGFSVTSRRSLLEASSATGDGVALVSTIAVPANITVPTGGQSQLLAAFQAAGYQHYGFNGTAWVLHNATAWLHKGNGSSTASVVGVHFYLPQPDAQGGQPTWRLGSSHVTAKGVAVATVDSDSITWNLLEATSYQLAVDDSSWIWLGNVTHVQRLQTQRGRPPSSTSANPGDTFSSVYSAIYAFYSVST